MDTQPATRTPLMRRLEFWAVVAAVAAVVAVVILVIVGRSDNKPLTAGPPPVVKASGTLTLHTSSLSRLSPTECAGSGGFNDIHEGAQVVVSDSTGKTLGLGQLSAGDVGVGECTFTFEVSVPRGEEFYQVEVSHRGKLQFTAEEIGSLDLTLGNG